MKKRVVQEITVEIDVCNICKKDITHRQLASNAEKRRIPMVNGIFKIATFDAHEVCINRVVREAFKKYI